MSLFLYVLHHTHCFPMSLKLPTNNDVPLFPLENLHVLNSVFHTQVIGKVVSLGNALNLWTNRL